MPTPDTQALTLWGPINNTRKKADLDEIARALNIYKAKDNKNVVLKKIQKHLKEHPELAKEKCFQGLFAYRKGAQESAASKSSTEKEAEDEREGEKTGKAATGALKMLVDRDIPRDPPARTARLNGRFPGSSAPSKATIEDGSEDEESSPEPVSEVPMRSRTPITLAAEGPDYIHPDEPQVEEVSSTVGFASFPETPKKTHNSRGDVGRGLDPDVIVAFQRDSGSVDEVHVPGAGRLVHHVCDQLGNEHPTIHLSELLPLALEYASTPMKDHGGRLSRPGTVGDSHVDIGSMAAFARNERVKYLESEKANSYKLEPACGDDGALVCRLFVHGEDSLPQVQASQLSKLTSPGLLAHLDTAIKPGLSSTIKAPNQSDNHAIGKNGEDQFIGWLRDKLDGPKREWRKGVFIADLLVRVKALRSAKQHLSDWGWEKSQGGYQVPEDEEVASIYAGRSFKKDDVLKALRLGSTTANSNDKLFAPAVMRRIPKLLEWFNEPDGEHAAFFQDMSMKEFLEWRDGELESEGGHSRKGKEKARKRKHVQDGDSKKRKKEKRLSSEDLE